MSIAGHVLLKEAFLLGVAVSIPFAVSWGVDQSYDAVSDIKRGVKNIGGLLYKTGFSPALYMGLGAMYSYIFVLFLITIGTLGPWAGLVLLTFPIWILCITWLWAGEHPLIKMVSAPLPSLDVVYELPEGDPNKSLNTGVRFGLMAIFLHTFLLVIATAVS